MKVLLFTDTLGDVNGVSRFIRNVAEQALAAGRDLTVITSTRFQCPDQPNIVNLPPRYARPMPGYPQLELVIPRRAEMFAAADSRRAQHQNNGSAPAPHHPDTAIHVSTPGPVGSLGRKYALKHSLPLLGTYHTDFPAYIDHLFTDTALTWVCTQVMRRFYAPFSRIFTRSADYADAMVRLGIQRDRIVRLIPGIDTDTFHIRYRDPTIWRSFPSIPPDSVKALYVGRVSVEKNLPLLTKAWKQLHHQEPDRAAAPHLIVIGDGPYRKTMETELAGLNAHFLGFRHGRELSTLYASADFFLFPSATDTLGQVVMEAQSAGLPVIVTDQGGPSEVVNHTPGPEQSGLVLSATDAGQWASAIRRLASDAPLRDAFGAAGHRKIQPMSIRHSFEHFWHVHEEARSLAHTVSPAR